MTRCWHVDRIHSYLMGEALRGLSDPVQVHPVSNSRHVAIWTELIFTAICHQTNWDRLHEALCRIALTTPDSLSPMTLSRMEYADFYRTFDNAFDADRLRVKERLHLLRDIGANALKWQSPGFIPWAEEDEILLAGSQGLYEWLRQFSAFSQDPLAKKARVLVHQLLRYGLISVTDEGSIAPAVDYHISRYYLRTGRVLPIGDVADRLVPDQLARVEFHTSLRKAVEEAMFYTAAAARMRIDTLNHYEWQIARSFCVRREPRCECGPLDDKPVDAELRVLYESSGTCPMRADCRGARNVDLRNLVDPRSARSYY